MNPINRIGMTEMSSVDLSRAADKKAIKDTFKTRLNNLEQEQIRDELKVLYGKIETSSTKLQNKLFLDDLIQYKKDIKEFLNIAVNNSHVFFKENSLDRRGRHRVYSLVKQVDQELDELAKDFIDIEENKLNILKRIDDIQGILLDILT